MCSQVHGDTVRTVTTADIKTDLYGRLGYEGDGLMTAIPGVTLVVFSADCIPVLLCDPVRRVIAAVHSGWRGTAAGIVTRAVERMWRCTAAARRTSGPPSGRGSAPAASRPTRTSPTP